MTFTCAGDRYVKGGPYPLEVRITTPSSYTSGNAAGGQNGSWNAVGRTAAPYVPKFVSGDYTVDWFNASSAGALNGPYPSSCGLRVNVMVILQEGLKSGQPNDVDVGSADGIVAGCNKPGLTVASKARAASERERRLLIQRLEEAFEDLDDYLAVEETHQQFPGFDSAYVKDAFAKMYAVQSSGWLDAAAARYLDGAKMQLSFPKHVTLQSVEGRVKTAEKDLRAAEQVM